jgi:hypothetical protein
MAKSTRCPLRGLVSICLANWSGVSTCSSKASSCTSPNTPRVFTLVSTRCRLPTPTASVCISPSPLCTCSSRSATCLKLSLRRVSSVLCSFSSTVLRISSSLAAFVCCSCASWDSMVARTSERRRAFDSLKPCNCVLSVSASVFCSDASCSEKASSCAFCVRVASAPCCTSARWKVAKACVVSWRAPRELSAISRRSSRSVRSLAEPMLASTRSRSPWSAGGCRRASSHITSTSWMTASTASPIRIRALSKVWLSPLASYLRAAGTGVTGVSGPLPPK